MNSRLSTQAFISKIGKNPIHLNILIREGKQVGKILESIKI